MKSTIKNNRAYNWISAHPLRFIYFTNLFLHLTVSIVFNYVITMQLGGDLWYELVAKSLISKNETTVDWGPDESSDLYTTHRMQIGEYKNWRPIGYSLFLVIPLLTGNEYQVTRSLLQSVFYSFIPVMLYLLTHLMLHKYREKKKISFGVAISYTVYPSFLISSQQNLDTGFITLLTITLFYLIIKASLTKRFGDFILISLFLFLLLIFRPIAAFTFLVFITALTLVLPEIRREAKLLLTSALIFIAVTFIFNYATERLYDHNIFNQSNPGYNLFLGNNPHTNKLLIERKLDCSTMEYFILPLYDKKFSHLIEMNEDKKNQFFINESLNFIEENPATFFLNAALKFIAFWSPIRYREGHWTKSELKETITLFTYGPLLIFFIISFIWFLIKKNKRYFFWKESMLFICLWMIPYLIFLPLPRYRQPVEFLMFVASAVFIYCFISIKKIKKKPTLG